MQATAYKESYTKYSTKSGNTKIMIYRRRKARRIIKHLLADDCYFLKQKTLGFILAVIGVVLPIIDNGNATFSLFIIPLALYALFGKGKLFLF